MSAVAGSSNRARRRKPLLAAAGLLVASTASGVALAAPTVSYSGGPIVSSGKVYVSCYGWDCTTADTTYQYVTGSTTGSQGWLQVFLANIGNTRWLNGVTQYTQTSPSLAIGNTVGGWSSSRIFVDTAKKIPGSTCSSNADCESNFCYTSGGQSKCIGYCIKNSDCRTPQFLGCNGRCGCSTSADCVAGATCTSGQCNVPTTCMANSDCVNTTLGCQSRTCGCNTNADCASGSCMSGSCTAPSTCATNSDCTNSLGCDSTSHGCHCVQDADCGGLSGSCLGGYCQDVSKLDVERSAWRARANFDPTNANAANNVYLVVSGTAAMDQTGSFHAYSDVDSATGYQNYYTHQIHPAYDSLAAGALLWEEIIETYTAPKNNQHLVNSWAPELVDSCSGAAAFNVALDGSAFRFALSSYVSNLANSGGGGCITARADRFDQFAVNGGYVWHSYGAANGYSASFASLPNMPTGYYPLQRSGATSWGNNRVDVYTADYNTSTVLDHVYWNGSAWAWDQAVGLPTGCTAIYGIDLASSQPTFLDLLATCNVSGAVPPVTLYHKRWGGSAYTAWHAIGTGVSSFPLAADKAAIAAIGADLLYVYARSSSGAYVEAASSTDGGTTWSSWSLLAAAPTGKTLTGSVDAAGIAPTNGAVNMSDVVVADTGGLIHWLHLVGTTPTWDIALPGAATGHTMSYPSIVSEGSSRLWISAEDSTTGIWHWTYDFAAGSWTYDNGSALYGVDSSSW